MRKLIHTFVVFQRSEKGNYHRLLASLGLAVFSPLVQNIVAPYYWARFVNKLEQQAVSHMLTWQNVIEVGIITYFAMILIGYIIQSLSLYGVTHLENKTMEKIDNATAAHVLNLSLDFFKDHFTGSLVGKQKEFSGHYETLYDTICDQIIPTIIVVGFSLPIIYMYSWTLCLCLSIYVCIFFLCSYLLSRRVKTAQEKFTRVRTKHGGLISDQISNIQTIKLFGRDEEEIERYKIHNKKKTDLRIITWMRDFTQRQTGNGLRAIMDMVIISGCYMLWVKGSLGIAHIVLVMSYTRGISDRMSNVGMILKTLRKIETDTMEMMEVLNITPTVVDVADTLPCMISQGHIMIKNISFHYHGSNENIFTDFSLEIPAGQKVGIVGESGSGKSTLMHLLMRMMDIQKGEITIDGIPIHLVAQTQLRQKMSIVPQETILFHRTVGENIAYDKTSATNEEIIAAAQKAQAHEFISGLTSHGYTGYHVKVGERGIKLSGGQRQRIGLARAFLQHKPLLILDEATSSLDSISEKEIQRALANLLHEQGTMIIIAHRLSTVHQLDRIIVMEHGKIIEDGKPEDLYKLTDGAYRRLVDAQKLITK